jgi:VWFA-related protein
MNRPRRILSLVGVSLLTFSLALARAPLDDNRRRVTFDVAVTDKNGNPIIGLAEHQFRIFEDNVEQTITRFGVGRKPQAVVLLVEFSDGFVYYDEVRQLADGFTRLFHPDDWMALVKFDVRMEIVNDFTRDRRALRHSLQRLPMPFHRQATPLDAVYFVLERMEDVTEKKAIVFITTGADIISEHSYVETLKKAETSDSMIYSIGMAAFARPAQDPYMESHTDSGLFAADNAMRSLAQATGGLSFFPRFSGQYREIYATVNADLKHQYGLEYVSTNTTADGKLRKLRVEVIDTDVNHDSKPDKLKVRHKKGYYAEKGSLIGGRR